MTRGALARELQLKERGERGVVSALPTGAVRRPRGAPASIRRVTACVAGGGRVVLVLDRGRVRAIASTAPGHRAPGLRRGLRVRSLGRPERVASTLLRRTRGSVHAARHRGGRVTAVVVADRRAARSRSALRKLVGYAFR
jgi:hypothetical protein